MNLDWITSPLAIYGVLASGGAAALYLVVSTRIEMRRQQKRYLAEGQSLREAVAGLEDRLRLLCLEIAEKSAPSAPYAPIKGINLNQRAEALRMYRRGSDRQAVATALGLPAAEVALLQKVHHLLSGGVAA